jgi:hypothetical protein
MPAIDLATASRRSNRPGHAQRVHQYSVERAVAELQFRAAKQDRRRTTMLRISGSVLVLLGCFGLAIGKGWILAPQAATVAIGMAAFTILLAELMSD